MPVVPGRVNERKKTPVIRQERTKSKRPPNEKMRARASIQHERGRIGVRVVRTTETVFVTNTEYQSSDGRKRCPAICETPISNRA